MKISLYLISAYEEYDNMHMCRGHWNYQWRGRRGKNFNCKSKAVKMRKESFGGLIQNIDGKIYKIDKKGFEVFKLLKNKKPLEEISKEKDVTKDELSIFVNNLKSFNIKINE